jgi:hypothetical protein
MKFVTMLFFDVFSAGPGFQAEPSYSQVQELILNQELPQEGRGSYGIQKSER